MYTLGSISQSKATCSQEDSRDIYNEIHAKVIENSDGSKWLYYNSYCHHEVELIAVTYINRHAASLIDVLVTYSPEPAAVFRFDNIEGILYANGAVALTYDDGDGLIEVWVEKDTVRLFNYPTPDEVKIDGDSSI